jgi:hypothetical protein
MWHALATFILAENWLLTPPVDTRIFRLRHRSHNPNKYQVVATLALAALSNKGEIELFKPQRIQPRLELEILEFPLPPKGWCYGLAAKQILLPNQSLCNWELEIDIMPSYSLDDPVPVNLAASNSKNVTTVPVTATPTKVLSANLNRKGVKFYSADKLKTVYLDTDQVVSKDSAIESLAPSKNVCVPTITWLGEWWAIASSGTVNVEVEEYL